MTEKKMTQIKKQPDYIGKIDELKSQMVEDLSALIKCESVKAEATEDAPFGKGVKEAFSYMKKMAYREGFLVDDVNGYGGHIDFGKETEETMGILCHLDVVPAGEGWEHAPFSGDVVDGVMYGRGTLDDKGPTVAAFYAMKALKDCGYEPKKKVRMVIGLDEETAGHGMKKYKERHAMPDFAIVPDSDFPLVHGEMGILIFDLVKKLSIGNKSGITLKKIQGGMAPNMVPDKATTLVNSKDGYDDLLQLVGKYNENTGYNVETFKRGKSLEISCIGKAAHGAMPWKGLNAISIMMDFLGNISFNNESVNEFINFYNQNIGFKLHGENISCNLEDQISGKLIWNVGLIDINEEKAAITVNVRCPVTLKDEDVYNAMTEILEKYDIGIVKHEYKPSLYYPLDSPIVKLLLDIYRERSGDYETKPLVIGGGTYAREMDNAIAYGALYPGDPDIMHEKNEYIKIDRLVETAKIYAEAIYALAICPEIM